MSQEIYRIETVAPEADGGGIIRRRMVRAESFDAAKAVAQRIFTLARRPHAAGPTVAMVRVSNGAGYELFSISIDD
ncbi:hypothetical protein [Microvirga antarctica]|uniref:hypothetical protein n=1 Tax=Microvirga antarctica TaxID=2819233 RepID=UPI001B30AD47|nr:hypothetical protein [Microvirga antarctica]